MTRFSDKIRENRERLELKQEQLAELVGVSRRSVIAYETGAAIPRERTMRKLAEALGVTQYYLTHDDCDDPEAGIAEEPFVQAARDAFGKKGADEMADLLQRNQALFAGGTLSESQKDMFFEAVSKAYFMNKEHARERFGRRKNKEGRNTNADDSAENNADSGDGSKK
ncbi:MAG: helix-turn-helix domain-containing protein [Clostridiales bacterium]|nr:helix-turn-helix domain-containing protein [Clostridiales bacterium]